MTFTEQVAFLDGPDESRARRDGTGIGFERLAAELERALAVIQ